MFEIGSSLLEARRRRGFGLDAVESATRIRARYLAALEEERFELLPGQTYARAFLREYADFLGLDAQLYVDEYNSRCAEPEPPPLPPARLQRRRPWILARAGTVLGIVLAVGVLSILAWKFGGPHQQPRAPKPPSLPHRAASRPVRTAPPAPALARLVLTASRGDCWLSVHVGSRAGQLLYEGMLRKGDSLRFASRQLWIRLGAPWNLDAQLNRKPLQGLPHDTGNVIVTPEGFRSA